MRVLESGGKQVLKKCLIEHQVFKVYFQFHRVCFNVDSDTHRNCVDDGNASRRKRHATRRKRGNVSGESFLDEGTKRRGNNASKCRSVHRTVRFWSASARLLLLNYALPEKFHTLWQLNVIIPKYKLFSRKNTTDNVIIKDSKRITSYVRLKYLTLTDWFFLKVIESLVIELEYKKYDIKKIFYKINWRIKF